MGEVPLYSILAGKARSRCRAKHAHFSRLGPESGPGLFILKVHLRKDFVFQETEFLRFFLQKKKKFEVVPRDRSAAASKLPSLEQPCRLKHPERFHFVNSPHSGLRRDLRPISARAFVTLPVGTCLYPYDFSYRTDFGVPTLGLKKSPCG